MELAGKALTGWRLTGDSTHAHLTAAAFGLTMVSLPACLRNKTTELQVFLKSISNKNETLGAVLNWTSCKDPKRMSTSRLHEWCDRKFKLHYQQSRTCAYGTPSGVRWYRIQKVCGFGRRKSNWVKTIPCSVCLCTVYFTGDEMSTVVHINLQNNIGKYSLTIWNCFTVGQKNHV